MGVQIAGDPLPEIRVFSDLFARAIQQSGIFEAGDEGK
jgi:hypothetical protein